MSKKVVSTDQAPAAVAAYSQGIIANGFVFTAGQVGLAPGTTALVEGGIKEQTQQALENVKGVVEAAGSSLDNVVKVTVFLANIDHFADMNAVYSTFFPENPPARSAFQVGKLPLGALIEIEAVALVE